MYDLLHLTGCSPLQADPSFPNTIFAGTDVGVFKTVDDVANWTAYREALICRQAEISRDGGEDRSPGSSRWVMRSPIAPATRLSRSLRVKSPFEQSFVNFASRGQISCP
jgi:hypothetical protein